MDDHAVALDNVTAIYEGERIPALYGITLAVDYGNIMAVVGPNGAGKTTLLEVINGLLPVTTGTVRALGEEVSPSSHRLRQRIAYLPQDLFFDPSTPFLARDVVLMGRFAQLGAFRFPGRSDHAVVRDALRAVGVEDLARRPIGRLSGGQQRKVLLARVIARRPKLLLLDEPMTNLDPQAKEELSRLILRIHAELSLTTIFVSHELGPLLDAADRVVTIVAGKIASDAPNSPVLLRV